MLKTIPQFVTKIQKVVFETSLYDEMAVLSLENVNNRDKRRSARSQGNGFRKVKSGDVMEISALFYRVELVAAKK